MKKDNYRTIRWTLALVVSFLMTLGGFIMAINEFI